MNPILILVLLLLKVLVTVTKMSLTIFIIVERKSYPFIIKYFNKRNETKLIAILSQDIRSTSIAFLIKLIIKKRINKLKATGTIQSLTVLPILQMLIF